jgi:RNA polymerase primary sigma factor
VKKYQGHGLELGELVAIGNEGLLKAVRKFDPDQGVKFISYAVWWVRQAVLKALAEQTRSVRIPLNQNSRSSAWARRDAARAGAPPRPHRRGAREAARRAARQRARARRISTIEVSLDAPVDRGGDRDAGTLGERFADGDGEDIEEATDFSAHARAPRRARSGSTSRRASARSSRSTTGSRRAPRR